MRNSRCRNVQGIRKTDSEAKKRRVSQATKALDHALHAASMVIVMMALRNGAVIVLEDLTNISDGWDKYGKFGRTLRRKLWCRLQVRPSREAQHTPDVILHPGVLVRGGRSLRMDRKVGIGGV